MQVCQLKKNRFNIKSDELINNMEVNNKFSNSDLSNVKLNLSKVKSIQFILI